jgi:hypothetical protein
MINLKFLNLIIASLFAGSLVAGQPDSEGWVTLDRPIAEAQDVDEGQKGGWVVFSKRVGSEKFLIELPQEPTYRQGADGVEIDASSETGESFHIQIVERKGERDLESRIEAVKALPGVSFLKAEERGVGDFELLYELDGRWILERLQTTPEHLYILQTFLEKFEENSDPNFADSLDVWRVDS